MASLLRWYTHKKPALAVQLSGKSQDAVSACAFEDLITTHISLWLAGTQLAWSTSSPLATGRTGIRFLYFLLSSPTWPPLHHKFLLPMIHACTFCIAPSPHLGLSDALLHCPPSSPMRPRGCHHYFLAPRTCHLFTAAQIPVNEH